MFARAQQELRAVCAVGRLTPPLRRSHQPHGAAAVAFAGRQQRRGFLFAHALKKVRQIEDIKNRPLGLYEPFEDPAPQSWVSTLDGRQLGIVDLDAGVFGGDIRPDIVHRVVAWQLANMKPDVVARKTRHDVEGSTRKLYRQKGTGRARAGPIRTPLRRGGGKAHPRRARSLGYQLQSKVVDLGLKCALSSKFMEGNLILLNNAKLPQPRTRLLDRLLAEQSLTKSVLLIDGPFEQIDPHLLLACHGLHYARVLPSPEANVLDVMKHTNVLLTLNGLRHLQSKLTGSPLASPFQFELEPSVLDPDRYLAEQDKSQAAARGPWTA